MVLDADKEDLGTKRETSPVAGGANTSSGHYINTGTSCSLPGRNSAGAGAGAKRFVLTD